MQTTPTDTTTAGATSIPKTAGQTTTSKNGRWRTFHKHCGLMQFIRSGTYYARAKTHGKSVRISLATPVFTTAKLRLADKLNELRKPPAEVGTFAEARLLYQADIENDHSLSPETKRYWRYRVDALLRTWPALDEMKLSKITESGCREWAKRFTAQFDPVNFNNTLASLRNILKCGGLGRDSNPAFKLKRLGAKPKELTLPEPEQFEKLVETVETSGAGQARHCADLVRFLAFSGCRKSESHQVTWADVDMERGEIKIHNAKRSKTSNAHELRFVPIIPAMRELLERLQSEQRPQPTDRVCLLGECEKSLTRACKIVGCARITHHDLRHLFATRCIEAGVDIPTVSRWLGHVDGGALAMKVYGHPRREHSATIALKVTFGKTQPPDNVLPLPKQHRA